MLKQIRAENPRRVLLVDGGVTFHGTYPANQTIGPRLRLRQELSVYYGGKLVREWTGEEMKR